MTRVLSFFFFFFLPALALPAQLLFAAEEPELLDVDQVIKLDLYVRCLIPGELDRSVSVELFPGVAMPIVARTDAALSKLIWIHHGSHRSRSDLRRILEDATPDELASVRCTAGKMDLAGLLDSVLDEPDEIDV